MVTNDEEYDGFCKGMNLFQKNLFKFGPGNPPPMNTPEYRAWINVSSDFEQMCKQYDEYQESIRVEKERRDWEDRRTFNSRIPFSDDED